jgi:hypothetical protein
LIDLPLTLDQPKECVDLFLRHALHANEQATAVAVSTGPAFNEGIEGLPSPKVEVADAEIGAVR